VERLFLEVMRLREEGRVDEVGRMGEENSELKEIIDVLIE